MSSVTIVDYGLGNLLSVSRAFEHCGATVTLTDSAKEIDSAERLVLPGVGACPDGMEGLRQRGLIESIRNHALSGRPFLGICLGMQMMLEESEEYGIHEGLGIIPGRVRAIPATDISGKAHRIPHIGWNPLVPSAGANWQRTPLQEVKPGSAMYFVHSFAADPTLPANRLADCIYGGHALAGVVIRGNAFGCQFHPEKSGETGLKIIRSFANWKAT